MRSVASLTGELAHVPRFRGERLAAAGLVVRPGGAADDLAVDEQLEGKFLRVPAAADQERDELAFDPKLRRREGAGGVVALEKRVDEPAPLKPFTSIWPGSVPRAGPGPNASPVTVHGA